MRRLRVASTATTVAAVNTRGIHHKPVNRCSERGIHQLRLEVCKAIFRALQLKVRALHISLRLHEFRIELLFNTTALSTRLLEIRLLFRFVLEELILLVHLKIKRRLFHFRVGFNHRNAILLELILRDVALLHKLGALFESTLETIEIDSSGLGGKTQLLSLVDDLAFLPAFERELRDLHCNISLIEFALLFALFNGKRLLRSNSRTLRGVHFVLRIFAFVDDLFTREFHNDIALRHASTFSDNLSDDSARLELVANFNLLLRCKFATHRKHHIERSIFDGVHIARVEGLSISGFTATTSQRCSGKNERETCSQ